MLNSNDASPATHFYAVDQVGTAQMELSGVGTPVWKGEFTPFGLELDTAETANRYKFTGKERDAESGLDYFGARYYGSLIGRWISPDWADKPEAVPYSDLTDPQSLNLYGYVRNNPLSKADPDGHCCWEEIKSAARSFAVGAGKYLANEGTRAALSASPAISEAAGVRNIAGTPTATMQSPNGVAETAGYVAAPVAQAASAVVVPEFGGEVTVTAEAQGTSSLISAGDLTSGQAANLGRFESKLPSGANPTEIRSLPNGGAAVQAEVPGKVPGSSAVYEKQMDASGKTMNYTKTTNTPNGDIAHVKVKYQEKQP